MAKQILNEDKPEMVALMKATLINDEGNIAWRRLEQLVSSPRYSPGLLCEHVEIDSARLK